jgi:hypothetical protein
MAIGSFGLTTYPISEWTVKQLREAVPWDTVPGYLPRGRENIFEIDFSTQVKAKGNKQVVRPGDRPGSEFLDHVIVFNAASLCRHVRLFTAYDLESRTNLSLGTDTAEPCNL